MLGKMVGKTGPVHLKMPGICWAKWLAFGWHLVGIWLAKNRGCHPVCLPIILMARAVVNLITCFGVLRRQPRRAEGAYVDIANEFLSAILNAFEANKRLADRAVEQVPDDKLHAALDPNTNSIAVIMKHVAGNLASRWTDFLTADGEKPWRNRDGEFAGSFTSRAELLEFWERGWACLFQTLKSLGQEDLEKTVVIRGEPHSVPLALARSLGHTCYHIGQIVQVARVHAGEKWRTLTIPRGGSEQFNQANWGQRDKSHS
jgi:hypothetical protein